MIIVIIIIIIIIIRAELRRQRLAGAPTILGTVLHDLTGRRSNLMCFALNNILCNYVRINCLFSLDIGLLFYDLTGQSPC